MARSFCGGHPSCVLVACSMENNAFTERLKNATIRAASFASWGFNCSDGHSVSLCHPSIL